MTIILDEKQKEALAMCLDPSKRLVSVTGEAGTGKTTLIEAIHDGLVEEGYRVAVCAPTGKAARRIKEATGIPAQTMHKLLEYSAPDGVDPKTGKQLTETGPRRRKSNRLEYDYVLADEYAMVNHELDRNLLDALPNGGCMCMFGDIFQLTPIQNWRLKLSPKSPFACHLERKEASVTLEQVYRQEEDSSILIAAHQIRLGRMFRRTDTMRMVHSTRPPEDLRKVVKDLRDKEGLDFGTERHQIIAARRTKIWVSTSKLNPTMRMLLNPFPDDEIVLDRNEWDDETQLVIGIGDKVVCNKNMYDLRDYYDRFEEFKPSGLPEERSFIACPENSMMLNGETGIILSISKEGDLEIDFGDRIVQVPADYEDLHRKSKQIIHIDPRKEIELAYVLTTHKTQGSEYDNVVYVMNRSSSFAQTRENMYTAITRAKYMVTIITDTHSIQRALRTSAAEVDMRKFLRHKEDVKRLVK